MANVYSHQLLNIHDGGDTTYQVPAGFVALLEFFTWFNADSLDTKGGSLVWTEADITIAQHTIGQSQVLYDRVHIVIPEGHHVHLSADAEVDVTVSGYLLSLP